MQISTLLNAAGGSDPGLQRENNEDRFHCDATRGIFIVIDGVGGQAAGDKAADTALKMLRARLERETGNVADRVREAIAIANNEVHRVASLRPEWQGMACVLTIAVVVNGDVVVGHVGDTRLYKLRGERIEKLTRDHSPVGEREDAGELGEAAAMAHPRRNEVYRDVGSEPHDADDPGFIDVLRVPFEPDAALLLCSDGLTDIVPAGDIQRLVINSAGRPQDVVRTLIAAANDAGGKDNVTVVYVENHRFTHGEDTRDLRTRRTASVAAPVLPPAVDAARPPSGRWRTALLTLVLLAVVGLAGYSQWDRVRAALAPATGGSGVTPVRIVVTPYGSIADAIAGAAAGSEIVVEPGEYRERLQMKSGVRVTSRVRGGAILRLPGSASETDPAVVASDAAGAALSGLRIVGDSATPLGIGVLVRNADFALTDVEISGAHSAAVQFERGGDGMVLAAYLHDNPGVAVVVRTGAAPRIAHSVFERNATSERAAGTVLIEADATPAFDRNVFQGVRPESIIVPAGSDGAAIRRGNWFIVSDERVPPASGRGPQRGRR